MADAVTSQTIQDDNRKAVLKFTNISDGTGESAVTKIDVSALQANSKGDSWIVVENPPVTAGVNRILFLLEGERTPDPWPTVQQCEIDVICE